MEKARLRWQRILDQPFIAPRKGSCAPDAVTTPDVLVIDDDYNIYIGAVCDSQERLIRIPIRAGYFETRQPLQIPPEAKVVLDPGPYSFDCNHVFDPATVGWDEKIYLYYSAIGNGPDHIGLAVSEDGIDFIKSPAPILAGRAPEVVIKDNIFSLFFVRDLGQGYSIFSAQSTDGVQYDLIEKEPVLTIGRKGSWDDFEVTTPRIFQINGSFYMIYAGLRRGDKKDIPRAFGLARSVDLIHWEKFPNNPVFTCAEHGSWDDGAIWFGTAVQIHDMLYLLYEGGRLENIIDQSPAFTQVGLAALPVQDFLAEIQSW